MARFTIPNAADFSVGYSHTQDVGDGRANPLGNVTLSSRDIAPGFRHRSFQPILRRADIPPLRFDSPQARLSIRINRQIRWNAGYQYYGYNEKFASSQDFRAQTGYSSLLFSF